ncbi:RusA family crossover junction endodeoxyribonuclease [Polaromonas sp.]|uniref:RusA family crossover junction endodeoxyribonuclease n=1 Tax=Polaromonas sp. TaxID=1869339 RepID=UPI003265A275
MITLTLPYPISANRYWATRVYTPKTDVPPKKCPQCGIAHNPNNPRSLTYVTSEAEAYKSQVKTLLFEQGVRSKLPGRVEVQILMYPRRPQDYKKRMRDNPLYWDDTVQRLDLDNARKVLNDSLKEIAIQDDFYIFKDGGEVMEPDGREACLVVTIRPYVRANNPQGDLLAVTS